MVGFTYSQALSDEFYDNLEKESVKKCMDFHKSRIMYAFIDGKIHYSLDDSRDHIHWLYEEYGIDEKGFENMDRGYIRPTDNISAINAMVYRGINHECTDVTDSMVKDLVDVTISVYGKDFLGDRKLYVYSGVIPAKVGEIWKPKELVKIVDMDEIIRERKE